MMFNKALFESLKGGSLLLIDLRDNYEYSQGHLSGSINLPLRTLALNIKRFAEDKNRIIGLYCEQGIKSAKALDILRNLGYINVYNLGGIKDLKLK